MAKVIDSIKTSNPQFKALHLRLLLSYLGVMMTILGMSAIAVYEFFATSIYQQLDEHLMSIAKTAIPTLEVVKHEYYEYRDKNEESEKEKADKKEKAHEENIHKVIRENAIEVINPELHYGIFQANPKIHTHGMEWFDDYGRLMIKQGNLFPNWYLQEKGEIRDIKKIQTPGIRTLILPIYNENELSGYIRVNESTLPIESTLKKLQVGLGLGGVIALGLTAIGGMWLTRQSVKPIENSFEQLKQFTADASHELRSPLTAIKTSVDVMQSHPERIHPADVKKLGAIVSATKQMTELVEDLLLLTRIDSEKIILKQNWIVIPLEEILEDLLDLWELQAEEKKITLKGNLARDMCVMGDGAKLTRLFSNLIGNAIQYTPEGGRITVSLLRQNRFVIVKVEDTGIGMTPAESQQVFNRFWRADKARNRREGGLGMGLAIAHSIVENHRGEISVTSQVGVGSCFQVKLPLSS
jgi:signal transduction histidine kinase